MGSPRAFLEDIWYEEQGLVVGGRNFAKSWRGGQFRRAPRWLELGF